MTDLPRGHLDPSAYQRHLRAAADRMIATIPEVDPDLPVPSCPDWTVRHLVEHLGQVHEWARFVAVSGRDQSRNEGFGVTVGVDLARWYADRVAALLDALAALDPSRPCYAHQPEFQEVGYWSRRQAHELSVHAVDLELAGGLPPVCDRELAADGIAEVLDIWANRALAWTGTAHELAGPVLIACADGPERWLVTPDGDRLAMAGPAPTDRDVEGAVASARGRTVDVLCALWRRDHAPLELSGTTAVAARFLGLPLVP